ncbi:MAG TPA: hypothetical protein VHY19_09610 [Steroidobacteraceae bacterium]|jgi:hypothetical protein|nr:hypothetical protein [Steroidobacteraceae bacterium]
MMHIVLAFANLDAGGAAATAHATSHIIASAAGGVAASGHTVTSSASAAVASASSSVSAASLDAQVSTQYAAQEKAYWAARPILAFCYSTPMGQWVRNSAWAFPFLQSWHFIGMTVLIGPLFALDLRVLGVARAVPLAPLHRFLPLVFVGFGINLVTGICFFCHDPRVYAYNISFRIKMLLIVLAGLNALWFRLGVFLDLERWGPGIEASRLAKVISAISIVTWLAVITAGRYIAFT